MIELFQASGLLPSLLGGDEVELPDQDGHPRVTLAPAVPVPPLWIGNLAVRRAARYGDAWFPSLLTPDEVTVGATRLAELAAGFHRPTPAITVGAAGALGDSPGLPRSSEMARNLVQAYGKDPEQAERLPITGGPAEVADRFAEYQSAGAGHVVIGLAGDGWRRQCEVLAEARALGSRP